MDFRFSGSFVNSIGTYMFERRERQRKRKKALLWRGFRFIKTFRLNSWFFEKMLLRARKYRTSWTFHIFSVRLSSSQLIMGHHIKIWKKQQLLIPGKVLKDCADHVLLAHYLNQHDGLRQPAQKKVRILLSKANGKLIWWIRGVNNTKL